MIDCKRITKLPKDVDLKDDDNVVKVIQKGGKRCDRIVVYAALKGDGLYLKSAESVLGGIFLLRSAKRYTACEICQRIDEGIGVSTDAARLMRDAVMALWKRVRLPLGVRRITRRPKPETAPDIIVVSKDKMEMKACDNIQCPKMETCRNYLPWEPCTLPYEIGEEANCEYYEPNGLPVQPRQLTIDFNF